MDTGDVTNWVNSWGPLITLVSTVVLALITGWLAYLTKVMADSANESATQARIAAEATLASVAVAEATVSIKFDVRAIFGSTVGALERRLEDLVSDGMSGDEEVTQELLQGITAWTNIQLTCRGNTVTVRGLSLTSVTLRDKPDDGAVRVYTTTHHEVPLASAESLPRIFHEDESLTFDVEGRSTGEDLVSFKTLVQYSIGDGPVRVREVEWTGKPPKPGGAIEKSER